MKKVTVTFYSPKELWRMFWNWAFWPRRKKCAEWMDYAQGIIESDLSDVFINNKHMIVQEYWESDELFQACITVVNDCLKKTEKFMSEPLPMDE